MLNPRGRQLETTTQQIYDLFKPGEGEINFYYGRIGSGKTYGATADVLEDLERGCVVYVNWPIKFDGFDQRKSMAHLFWRSLLGIRHFYRFPAGNLRYIDTTSPDCIDELETLMDCRIYLDEGQWIFDSYEGTKTSVTKRRLILHTRHVNRVINIISQRPTAINVTARANVNRWYKFEVKMRFPWLVFKRTEFQEMKGDIPDEDPELAASTKVYFASKRVLKAYDTRYLRNGAENVTVPSVDIFSMGITARLSAFIILLFRMNG